MTVAGGPALGFDDVSLTLGQTDILQQVSLRVAAGGVHALVGPNGGGKSSLFKALLGQVPHRGSIALEWPGERPGVVGYVPQALAFDAGLPMTVMDFMGAMCQRRPVMLGLSRRWKAPVEQALRQVGMWEKAQRRMGALSGGERQRVLLAQALIPAPDLILLDEPMSALDEAGMRVFETLLAHWRGQRTTVLWIEHDLDAVTRLADRVTGLNRQVLFDGAPAEVLTPQRVLALFSNRHRHEEVPVAEEVLE
ncbi:MULTISPECIES: metal ABC transporter ATP-binding protein [Hydrogenophaga]|uniref:ABC transporter ATP-binding protein n=1 Tax=Hydrogenophaga intermedia TaxID=65786 RepID=A0A1L1PP71_HYDIT|nr:MULTISPECIES: metal ABC transporter ATP-binding protein [Hydrogenophaga]AOS78949.1 manganese ABC transporter ATP-binding protein [Hydrogenophaga sp. PBC]TMU74478.1 metal ABC transporter ATP-binding protein [Hydrogenophaga intermedia]CDN90564.1 ABC transporter ATP-binding protein [Hydrogenophaga intermedia]